MTWLGEEVRGLSGGSRWWEIWRAIRRVAQVRPTPRVYLFPHKIRELFSGQSGGHQLSQSIPSKLKLSNYVCPNYLELELNPHVMHTPSTSYMYRNTTVIYMFAQ